MFLGDEERYIGIMKDLLSKLESQGAVEDRTGVGTASLYGVRLNFHISDTLPVLKSKAVAVNSMMGELIWFLLGSTNNKHLNTLGSTIWDEWAREDGELGPIYGKMWRDWDGKDQIYDLVQGIKNNPHSRRHIVSGWNPTLLPDPTKSHRENVNAGLQVLPPCHTLQQYFVDDGFLHMHLYQRSADWFLGVPFNIASYGALLKIIAKATGYKPGVLMMTFGDAHLYSNHLYAAKLQIEQFERYAEIYKEDDYQFHDKPICQDVTLDITDELVSLVTRRVEDITDEEFYDIINNKDRLYVVNNYTHMGAIKASVAV